jgi:hypothetical protein
VPSLHAGPVTRKRLRETAVRTAEYQQTALARKTLGRNIITNSEQFTGNPPYSILPYSSLRTGGGAWLEGRRDQKSYAGSSVFQVNAHQAHHRNNITPHL